VWLTLGVELDGGGVGCGSVSGNLAGRVASAAPAPPPSALSLPSGNPGL
jgi:hypothetical protein